MFLLSLIVGLFVWFYPLGLEQRASAVLVIMLFAGALWFTEAIPLHVTALFIPLLLFTFAGFTPKESFVSFFDPVVVLILGGFILAIAMQKHKLDEKIAYFFINRFGHTPGKFLLGLMVVTAFLSMWMTNTATTALIIPIAIVILSENNLQPLKSKYGKAVILGIAYAATIGGMGTLVGSTPNAIAAKFLGDHGITLSFVDWMVHALPLVIILLPIAWFVLIKFFPPEKKILKVKTHDTKTSAKQKWVLAVFGITVTLWLTTSIHGVSASMISVVPIILLYLLNLLNTADFSKAHWPALMLFGGGLALGTAISAVGLDLILANALTSLIGGQPILLVFAAVIVFAILMTLLASNTAAAAILIPVSIPMALVLGIDLKILVMLVALGVSLDFVVPVGTPPSTIAYATGYIKVRDMAFAGTIIAILGVITLSGLGMLWLA